LNELKADKKNMYSVLEENGKIFDESMAIIDFNSRISLTIRLSSTDESREHLIIFEMYGILSIVPREMSLINGRKSLD
jgi:hypothetical protein